ncbi:hypothetical protein [Amycolatopsis sp. NPDC003861]
MGGQWAAPGQTALLALLDELGLPTFARYREGRSLYNVARYLGPAILTKPAHAFRCCRGKAVLRRC